MVGIFFLPVVLVTLIFPMDSIGQMFVCNNTQTKRSDKIVGGRPANPGEIPYIISLQSEAYNGHFCGASLVWDPNPSPNGEQIVITAAHCVQQFRQPFKTLELKLMAGSTKLGGETGTTQVLKARKIIVHPNYTARPTVNDIAIIFIDGYFNLTEYVSPINLPNSTCSNHEYPECLLVSGWGYTEEDGNVLPDDLQVANVPVVDNSFCSYMYSQGSTWQKVFETNICAGELIGGKDSCQGDSGGPLAKHGDIKELIGITSFGRGCARENFPGVYTRVSSFLTWISDTVRENRD